MYMDYVYIVKYKEYYCTVNYSLKKKKKWMISTLANHLTGNATCLNSSVWHKVMIKIKTRPAVSDISETTETKVN